MLRVLSTIAYSGAFSHLIREHLVGNPKGTGDLTDRLVLSIFTQDIEQIVWS